MVIVPFIISIFATNRKWYSKMAELLTSATSGLIKRNFNPSVIYIVYDQR